MLATLKALHAKAAAEHSKYFAAMQDPAIDQDAAAMLAGLAIRYQAIRDYLESRLAAYD